MRRGLVALLAASLVFSAAGAAYPKNRNVQIGSALRMYHPNGPGDATVVAVLDFGLMPYHWDFVGSKMPQHNDRDKTNDLPLGTPPHDWLPGFPNPKKEFASYQPLMVSLEEKDRDAKVAALRARDEGLWSTVRPSKPDEMNYYWLPGTKVIGAMTFSTTTKIVGAPGDHGVGTTSSAVGNIHGTCPECLLFFIELGSRADSEAAIEWAMRQPWIDAISNSYGFSLGLRDRLYSGSNVEAQARASERGQTIFFSAGNGQANAFAVPNTTSFSSQEGPDWIVTVGAISPGEDNYYYREHPNITQEDDKTAYHASYSGHGKPADVAGIGRFYPTAYTADSVAGTGTSGFGGTSNATPQIAGTYARALYLARRALPGASKIQRNGVVAKGKRIRCGKARRRCELGDGKLTAAELRTRLFHGAIHTAAGTTPAGVGTLPPIGEEEFLSEGHGSYMGLETGRFRDYVKELDRIVGPMLGRSKTLERPPGEREWMIVDSYCRQGTWGQWKHGYYVDGKTKLPENDPSAPLRSLYLSACPAFRPPP